MVALLHLSQAQMTNYELYAHQPELYIVWTVMMVWTDPVCWQAAMSPKGLARRGGPNRRFNTSVKGLQDGVPLSHGLVFGRRRWAIAHATAGYGSLRLSSRYRVFIVFAALLCRGVLYAATILSPRLWWIYIASFQHSATWLQWHLTTLWWVDVEWQSP
jgi:hypothetical protein